MLLLKKVPSIDHVLGAQREDLLDVVELSFGNRDFVLAPPSAPLPKDKPMKPLQIREKAS